jgi:hypothetical protein
MDNSTATALKLALVDSQATVVQLLRTVKDHRVAHLEGMDNKV